MIKLLHAADLHIGIGSFDRLETEAVDGNVEASGRGATSVHGSTSGHGSLFDEVVERNGISGRFLEISRTLDRLVGIAEERDVDMVLIAGDIFHRRNPFPHEENLFASLIRNLLDMDIVIAVLMGNHEVSAISSLEHSLDVFNTLAGDNFHLLAGNQVRVISTKSGEIQVASIPWATTSDLHRLLGDKHGGGRQDWELYYRTVMDHLTAILRDDLPSVLCAHAYVTGADSGIADMVNTNGKPFIPLSVLNGTPFDYIALGHLHSFQRLPVKPAAYYSGSLIRNSFNEEGAEKGVILVQPGARPPEFIPIETVRDMITISVDITGSGDPVQALKKAAARRKTDDAIVRINYTCPVEMPGLTMSQAMAAIPGAWNIVLRRNSVRSEVMADASFTISDPVDMLSEYIDTRTDLKGMKEELMQLAARLMEEA